MTNRLFQVGLLGLMLFAAAGAYTVRQLMGSGPDSSSECTRDWLCLSGSQYDKIRQEYPNFQSQAQVLTQSLQDHRQRLASLIADPNTPLDRIRSQAHTVLDTHHTLMRRIVDHWLAVRRYADVQQCLRLNQLCSGVMGSPDTQGGPGRGRQMHGRGGGPGPGMGMGMGMGMGGGQQHRYGRLAPALALTPEQQEMAAQYDPNYDADAVRMSQSVCDAHRTLAQAMADPNTSDASILQVLESYIATRTELEQRTVEYVLSLRLLLSAEQQQRLIGLSQGGRRWQGGRNEADGP